eukprot:TRINITY_DN34979_c0_g1_i2.p1 TRINITY_DN34979_c0_g1~~TRINITY_DN34979_c0_g1_i2.p1  ORF type:complete len:552 (+),score=86.97 TRINITY_DN34979_c0_g1_i2:431-2086(+)
MEHASEATGPHAPWRPAGGRNELRAIVLLLADDLGWGDLHVYDSLWRRSGRPAPQTPELDRMAQEGTALSHFYAMSPVCSASRASFLTGQLPTSPAVRTPYIYGRPEANERFGQANWLNTSVLTTTRLLQRAGWRTAHFGKWHLGGTSAAPAPGDYGIDEMAVFGASPSAPGLTRAHPALQDSLFPAASSELIVDRGISFVRRAAAERRKFYLNLWFHTAHAPLNPSEEQFAPFPAEAYCGQPVPEEASPAALYAPHRCPPRVYLAAVRDMDAHVGRFLAVLRRRAELRSAALVLFSSDNGPEDPAVYFNSVGSTGPFRGRKRSLYEGGIRMPLVAWWPGSVPAGAVSEVDVAAVDLLPTFAALAAARITRGERNDLYGRDASSGLLSGELPPRQRPLAWDYRFRMLGDCWHHSPRLALREGSLKLLAHPDGSRLEVYNTTEDLGELVNIANERAAWAKRQRAALLAWARTQPQSPRRAVVLNEGCSKGNRHLARLAVADVTAAEVAAEAAQAEARERARRQRKEERRRRREGDSVRRAPGGSRSRAGGAG